MGDARVVIITPEGIVDYEDDKLNIKGRGNMTWFDSPKKPYAIKLNKKAKLLGMPKGKRWCLLANFFDRTLMRNDIAFHIASMTGLGWTPKGQFVELIMNGNHVGNYYLCEQIKIDENRVNIKEMKSTDIEGDDVTGGYLVEVDTYYDEVNKFRSKEKSFPYMFKSPDEETLQTAQFEYFKNYVDSMETKMYSEDWLERAEYRDYIDLKSFADFWIVNELAINQELMHPKSTYLYKDKLKKLTAGPVWDFDCSTFVASRTEYFIAKDVFYYERLFSDPEFVRIVKDRWKELKPNLTTIPDYIRKTANMIKKSNDINIKMWPITIVCNGDESFSFEEAVDNLVLTYNKKFKWMSEQIEKW